MLKKVIKWIFILSVAILAGIYIIGIISNCGDGPGFDENKLAQQLADQKIKELESIAAAAIQRANESDIKAAQADEKQRQAIAAANKDRQNSVKLQKEIDEKNKIIAELQKDSPCINFDFTEYTNRELISSINLLCLIDARQKESLLLWEEKNKASTSENENLRNALSNCNKKSSEYKKSRDEFERTAKIRLRIIEQWKVKYESEKSKNKKHRHRKFWQKMKDYLLGAAFGAAIVILK